MKSQFAQVVRIHLYKIVIGVLLLGTVICTGYYFHSDDKKTEPLLAGMVTGLIVALIQYLLDWNEHEEIEKFKKLGIQRILPHRDDKGYYRELLSNAKVEILVLGHTASRLMEDFAHPARDDSQTLIEALVRGVKVQILLPRIDYLAPEDRHKAENANKRMQEITTKFPEFQVRHFDHTATHSLFKVDSQCLFGPIFPHIKSKDSPTVHASSESAVVQAYLKYFYDEWERSAG